MNPDGTLIASASQRGTVIKIFSADGGETLGDLQPFSTGSDGGEVRRITERSLNGVALYTTLRVGEETEPGEYTLSFQAPGLEGCHVTTRVEAPQPKNSAD